MPTSARMPLAHWIRGAPIGVVAAVASLLLRVLPALLDDWGLSTELLTILFGVGVLQVLMTAPGGIVDQLPKDLAKLGRRIRGLFHRRSPAA